MDKYNNPTVFQQKQYEIMKKIREKRTQINDCVKRLENNPGYKSAVHLQKLKRELDLLLSERQFELM